MPIIVHSPYSGLPVKVRDQDISRALRDEEGRIFYALPKSDGSGYYGSPTRQGSALHEQRAAEMAQKMAQAKVSGKQQTQQQLHDATGRKRGGKRRVLVVLIVLAAIVAGVWYFLFKTPMGAGLLEKLPEAVPTSPSTEQPATPADGAQSSLAPIPWVTTVSGLRYRIDESGHGQIATAGKFVRIYYTVAPGSDPENIAPAAHATSEIQPQTLGFVLWSGQAIRGWDEGIAGMRLGETRTLLLPPQLISGGWAGRQDANLPDATLRFQITLLEVLPGIEHQVLQAGAGRIARPGDSVEFHYVTYVEGRTAPCDNSASRGRPLRCRIGDNQLIPGWELGLVGMAEGETRKLVIPPYLAYGGRGAGALIPPDATLRVEIELLRILPETTSEAMLSQRPTLPRLGG